MGETTDDYTGITYRVTDRVATIALNGNAIGGGITIALSADYRLAASITANPDAVAGVPSFLQKRPPEFTLSPEKDLPDVLQWSQS